jgi:hypothetical protein
MPIITTAERAVKTTKLLIRTDFWMPSAMQSRPFHRLAGILSRGPASGERPRRKTPPHKTVLNERILPEIKLMIIPIFLTIFK